MGKLEGKLSATQPEDFVESFTKLVSGGKLLKNKIIQDLNKNFDLCRSDNQRSERIHLS